MKSARFTVLGATGYIGHHLVRYLHAQGHDVQAPGRGSTPDADSWGHVIDCAGLTGDFRQRPFDTMQAHVGRLAPWLEQGGFDSFLYLSSTRVYAGAERADEDAALLVRPGDPSDLYNLSKLAGEALCHACQHPGVRVVRLSNVVGPGMSQDSGNLVADLLAQARAGHVELRSDPRSRKDYIHLHDVLDYLPRIALQGRHRCYNLASGQQLAHADWLDWLRQHTGCTVAWPQDGVVQRFPMIHTQRLQAEWGFRPRPVLDLALLAPQEPAP